MPQRADAVDGGADRDAVPRQALGVAAVDPSRSVMTATGSGVAKSVTRSKRPLARLAGKTLGDGLDAGPERSDLLRPECRRPEPPPSGVRRRPRSGRPRSTP